jgi:hypothetical protein
MSKTCRLVINAWIKIYFVIIIIVLVCLEAPDTVMIERAAGKRIDPKTKGYYNFFHEFFS